MHLIRYISLFIFLVLPGLCLAQGGNFEDELLSDQQQASERYILNNSIQQSLPVNQSNAAFIVQDGSENAFLGNQLNTGSSRNPNVITVIQSGNLNNINMDQSGDGQNAKVIQRGINNNYESSVSGRDIETSTKQYGNNNEINQQIAGDGLNYRLIQQGNNNQINQIENGSQNSGYQVIQQGSDMHITITNGF